MYLFVAVSQSRLTAIFLYMKLKYLLLLCFFGVILKGNAQFGFVKKSEIDVVKDSRIVVVLFNDSNYNASIQKAFDRYWKFNGGYIFVSDTMLKQYQNKPEYIYLVFSKSKASNKLKIKACSTEDDMNGLILTKKYKRKVTTDVLIAYAFCSNKIDTPDWYPEMVRAVQLLNNFMDLAAMAKDDKSISTTTLTKNYPTNKTSLNDKTLYVLKSDNGLKGKEDGAQLWGNSYEVLDERDEMNKLILEQNPDALYFFSTKDAEYCNKLIVTASGTELMYYTSTKATDPCQCTAKDLKALKEMRVNANKVK